MAFLNWRFGLTQMTAWWIEVAPVPGLSNAATPQNLSSPSQHPYIEVGMVMIGEKGVLSRSGSDVRLCVSLTAPAHSGRFSRLAAYS